MGLMRDITAGLRPLTNFVYPPRCPLCGVALAEQGGLCVDCWKSIEAPQTSNGAAAGEGDSPRHSGIIAASVYNEASRDLVLRFKHGGKITLAQLMARMMAMHLEKTPSERTPLLVPVPLHRMRVWQRGFNQSALLAQELAKLHKGELCLDALMRTKRTPSLGGLGKEDRKRALNGAIAMRATRVAIVRGRDVSLVDDVYTSGATSHACVDVLLEAGARSVTIVCFARVTDG